MQCSHVTIGSCDPPVTTSKSPQLESPCIDAASAGTLAVARSAAAAAAETTATAQTTLAAKYHVFISASDLRWHKSSPALAMSSAPVLLLLLLLLLSLCCCCYAAPHHASFDSTKLFGVTKISVTDSFVKA
jgi:hypothetical protein